MAIEHISKLEVRKLEGIKWNPKIGQETEDLLEYYMKEKGLDSQGTDTIKNETYQILSMCGDPMAKSNSDTGLVVGYVQSGKTMSFTTLAALAKDNGYQLIILIAGTSNPLRDQTVYRLKKDLRFENRFNKTWTILVEPKTIDSNSIDSILEEWKDESFPEDEKRTILIVVKKNSSILKSLLDLLDKIKLDNVPTLIIDDEGDQASMNTKARANILDGKPPSEWEVSAVYNRIITLKNKLPHHTFLQYTATPQAPLFINILDILSPNFIQLLSPGNAYVGGKVFFVNNSNLVQIIPFNEISTDESPLESPPESLMESMRLFFLGVLLSKLIFKLNNVSMLVHPSHLTEKHNQYHIWVSSIKKRWERSLNPNNQEEDKKKLIEEFRHSYSNLIKTNESLPRFDDLEINRLMYVIRETQVKEVNAKRGKTPQIDWNNNYSYILVGGQAMDRGFTVEGLTVTYMPRGKGGGNVDTVQQRARFFGYKKKYIGICRVFLTGDTYGAYRGIVEHEEDIRRRLSEHKLTGRHMNEFERKTILSELLKLTRRNILTGEVNRNYFGKEWFRIKAPHDIPEIIKHNREVLTKFISNTIFKEDLGHKNRTEDQKHSFIDLELKSFYENVLSNLKFTRESDSNGYIDLKLLFETVIKENEKEIIRIYLMKKGSIRERRLTRKDNVIQQLFQGKNPKVGEVIYPGDEKIKEENNLTLQIHHLNLTDSEGRNTVHEDVYTIAVWVPDSKGKDYITLVENETN